MHTEMISTYLHFLHCIALNYIANAQSNNVFENTKRIHISHNNNNVTRTISDVLT